MSPTFDTVTATYYNAMTHKVVPKDAVVLDLDEATRHMADGLGGLSTLLNWLRDGSGIFAKKIADQIEAQTKPPRIPEPELYKIIEAGPEWHRRKWVRGPKGWTNVDAEGHYLNWSHWDSLENPRLIES